MLWEYLRRTVIFWVPGLIFIAIANQIRGNEPLPGDVAVLQDIHTFSTTTLNKVFEVITALGSPPVVLIVAALAAATMWYLGQRRNATFLLFAAGGAAAINFVAKLLFTRERPDLWQHIVVEDGYSFPSGHAMVSMSLALAVIILAWPTRYRWVAVTAGVIYAALIGLSRLYLGVHFPSDIIGGWCISILWILTLYHTLARFSRRRTVDEPTE